MSDKEEQIQHAKLAKQAEHYDDLVACMKAVTETEAELYFKLFLGWKVKKVT